MGLYKHPNSPYWYYLYSVNGKRITGSTRTTRKKLARQIAEAKKIDFLRRQSDLPTKQPLSLQELCDDFLAWSKANKITWDRDVIFTGPLLKFFGNRDISDIRSYDVEKFKAYRVKKVSPATVNKEVACLRRMYNLAIQWGKTTENPTKGVKKFREPKKSFRWWTEEEIEKFLNACLNERMKAVTLIGINTGMRVGEILGLKWVDIDFNHKYITIQESKSGEYRKVRMNQMIIDVLNGIKRNGEYVFSHENGARVKRIIKGFKLTAERAGIAPSSPHVMRHTFASHLTMLGVDPHTIMELGGWKSLDMVMRYSHLAPDHKQRAVDGLSEKFKNRLSS
ncbi:site-specific integrase [candidate division KSB1 bacterium]|nr:site-specific integrase [candidate division KSB1 bacterium]